MKKDLSSGKKIKTAPHFRQHYAYKKKKRDGSHLNGKDNYFN